MLALMIWGRGINSKTLKYTASRYMNWLIGYVFLALALTVYCFLIFSVTHVAQGCVYTSLALVRCTTTSVAVGKFVLYIWHASRLKI